jgi:hypothetical protein
VNAPDARRDDSDARRGQGSGGGRTGPRNFLAPGERRRLFWTVMPAGLAALALLGWVERTWFPRRGAGGQGQVDTRLEAVSGPAPRGDEVLIERDPEPLAAAPADDLAASRTALARVRDATTFRDADNDAWFQVWQTLQEGDRGSAGRARPRDVSFRELFGQPRSFRGRLVRMKGTLRRAERLPAPPNDYGVDHFWQCWMEPAGGPASPVVIQCLTLPEGMPAGLAIGEPVEVTGYFFKNFAYNAADAIRVAPVIMTAEPTWEPVVAAPRSGLAGPGGVTLVVAASVAAVVGATWLGGMASRRRASAARPAPAADLDAALADLDPVSIEESLRRMAADQARRGGSGGGLSP